jgi:hypothetical protein
MNKKEYRCRSWSDWYRFARETLEYGRQEATEYAGLRFAEELNRRAGKEHLPQPTPSG